MVDERLLSGVGQLDPEAWAEQQVGLQKVREDRAKHQFGPDKWAEFERRAPGRRVTRENYQERFVLLDQMGYKPSTRSQGFHLFDSAGSTVKKVGKAAIKLGGDIITAPTKGLAALTKNIPVLGDVTRIVDNVASGPANLANSIASGARLDQAALKHLKSELKNIKDAAPYAQMVVSVVPGVGTGVAAAIGAGAALAEGKSIDDIAKAVIRSSLPGGALAASAYDTALKVAAGGNVAQATLEAARAQLPKAARHAFDIGLAVVTGENIQNALADGFTNLTQEKLSEIVKGGAGALVKSQFLVKTLGALPKGGDTKRGFLTAIGLLGQTGINAKALAAVRHKLSEVERTGFDAALRSQQGEVAWLADVPNMPPPSRRTPALTAIAAALTAIAAPARKPPAMTPIPAAVRTPPAMKAAPARKPPAMTPIPAAVRKPPAMKAIAPKAPSSPAASAARSLYGPYPQPPASGVGAWSSDAWRWFTLHDRGTPLVQRGPVWLSDNAAFQEEAELIESAQRHGRIANVARWDWDADARRWQQALG